MLMYLEEELAKVVLKRIIDIELLTECLLFIF